jgi:hypothetical protein
MTVETKTKKVGSDWREYERHFDDQHRLHRDDGPAYIERDCATKTIREEGYYFHGLRHRVGLISEKPARIGYDMRSDIRTLAYFVNGLKHRESGPAEILYANRKVITELWFQNGEMHRLRGPAYINHGNSSIEFPNGPEAHIERNFKFRGKEIPDWVPLFDPNLKTCEQITPAFILRIMMEFDREYGQIVKEEAEKLHLLKKCA